MQTYIRLLGYVCGDFLSNSNLKMNGKGKSFPFLMPIVTQDNQKFFLFASDLDFEDFRMGFCDEIELERVARCGGALGYYFRADL